MTVSLETIRRIFSDEGFFEIGPWPDSPDDTLVLRTVPGEHSEKWFGEISLILSPEAARVTARALIAAADEIEQKIPK